jgi:hypothetical protein
MWIKLDFTPLFISGLLIGLVLVAIGLVVRSNFPKISSLGVFIIVVGAIPALLCGVVLVGEQYGDWRDKSRSLSSIEELTEDREIQGIRLPRGTKVEWTDKLMPRVILAQPLTVLGIALEGELKFANTLTNNDLHVATDLETGTLSTDQLIDGVPCKAHKEVEFFRAGGQDPEDGKTPKAKVGKLKRCTPSAEFDFAGNRYLDVGEVTLNGFDGVEKGVLAADQDVDGHWCKRGTEVLRPDKRAIAFTLARDETVSGIACKAGEEVVIEPWNFRVTSAVLAHDQEIGGIHCRGGEAVGFVSGNGSYPLDSCVIRSPAALLDIVWPAGSKLKGLGMTWLEVTLPAGSAAMVGDVKIVGRCKINLSKAPRLLTGVEAMRGETGYAELRGTRFTDMSIYEGSGWGHLAEPARVDENDYEAGANIRFKLSAPK